MGARGPKKRPTALAALHGNPSKRRLPTNEPQGQGDLWAPPGWFDDDQRAQWDYAVEHAPPGLLTGTDRETLAIWCVACVEYARAVKTVRAEGQIVETTNGNAIQHPALGIMNKQALVMLKAGAEMGFSPSARASLGTRAIEHWEPIEGGMGRSRSSELAAYLEEKPDNLN